MPAQNTPHLVKRLPPGEADTMQTSMTVKAPTASGSSNAALMAEYDLALCSRPEELHEALRLRLDVFAKEQGFPEDTEVDE